MDSGSIAISENSSPLIVIHGSGRRRTVSESDGPSANFVAIDAAKDNTEPQQTLSESMKGNKNAKRAEKTKETAVINTEKITPVSDKPKPKPQRGTASDYRVRRLRRDHPDIAERLECGEFKAKAAKRGNPTGNNQHKKEEKPAAGNSSQRDRAKENEVASKAVSQLTGLADKTQHLYALHALPPELWPGAVAALGDMSVADVEKQVKLAKELLEKHGSSRRWQLGRRLLLLLSRLAHYYGDPPWFTHCQISLFAGGHGGPSLYQNCGINTAVSEFLRDRTMLLYALHDLPRELWSGAAAALVDRKAWK